MSLARCKAISNIVSNMVDTADSLERGDHDQSWDSSQSQSRPSASSLVLAAAILQGGKRF